MKNKFGEAEIFTINDITGNIYATCTACMSIYSEFLTWANKYPYRMVDTPSKADAIIVLSCQVTDLAILNDIRHLEKLMSKYPDKNYYISGCLAYRFDIDLPAKRLTHTASNYTPIENKNLVNFAKPFWVRNFQEKSGDGNLFRDMYPLRIGVGCNGKCKYCTINTTRGEAYELLPQLAIQEFLNHDNIILIADSPSKEQIEKWCSIAYKANKPISIRNLEPNVAIQSFDSLVKLSQKGLLKILHVPIQHLNAIVLKDMHRRVNTTMEYIKKSQILKDNGVELATNIIIDYKNSDNPDMNELQKIFDYISWNPYWDGKWDRKMAEKRFKKYFEWSNV